MAGGQDSADLLLCTGQYNQHGQLGVRRQAIAFVGATLLLALENAVRRENRLQSANEGLPMIQRR